MPFRKIDEKLILQLETILDAATSDERSVTSVGSVVLDAITTVKEEPKSNHRFILNVPKINLR